MDHRFCHWHNETYKECSGVRWYITFVLTLKDVVMFSTASLLCAFLLTSAAFGRPETETLEGRASSSFRGTCHQITKAISDASRVFFPRELSITTLVVLLADSDQASPQYVSDIFHAATSSSEESACSVEPGTADDVSKIVSLS